MEEPADPIAGSLVRDPFMSEHVSWPWLSAISDFPRPSFVRVGSTAVRAIVRQWQHERVGPLDAAKHVAYSKIRLSVLLAQGQ